MAEKDPVAKKIACALCEDRTCEREEGCLHVHTDIFIHYKGSRSCSKTQRARVPCAVTPHGKKPFYFTCNSESCSTYVASTDTEGIPHSIRTWKRIKMWRNESPENKKRITPERVKYFVIDGSVKTIVVATNGVLLDLRCRENDQKCRKNPLRKIKECAEWKTINQELRYLPIRKHSEKWKLCEKILVENHFGEVDELFFATDYDIAGSYIALTILEEVNRKRKINKKEDIPLSRIKRLILKTLTPQEIKKELEKPQSFDWGNAFGGKLRNTVDYLFGTPLTNLLRNRLHSEFHREASKKLEKIGIGRVQFPALWFIINRDWEAAKNTFTNKFYFVFNSYNTVEEVQEAVNHQKFSAFLVREHKSHYSQSQFIKDLATNKVGTHTTRRTTMRKLEEGGLIYIDEQERIRGTRLGLQYYNMLRSRLSTDLYDFASLEFNRQLYDDIASFKDLDQKIENNDELLKACQHHYDELMRFYYNHIRELVLKFENTVQEIVSPLGNLLSSTQQKEDTSIPLRSGYRSSDYTAIIEGNSPVDIEKVEEEFGSFNNLKNIERKFKKMDLAAHLRLLLQIPRENDFQILGIFGANALEHLNEDNTVLFSVQLEGDTELCEEIFKNVLENVIEGTLTLSSIEKIETLEFKERIELAHEPLHTVNLQYRNVEGEKGKFLVMEYDRPYLRTMKQLFYFKLGLVKAFTLGGLRFELVDSYELFEAHNFESMLFTMHEKYGLALDETAKMMQRLYLGGGEP